MPIELTGRHCAPLPAGTPPLDGEALAACAAAVPQWRIEGRETRQLGDALSASGRPLPGIEARPQPDQRRGPQSACALGWQREGVPSQGWPCHLRREFRFPDFAAALAFVNRIGELAEGEQHHPDIALGWGRVAVATYTHSIGGLSENDFILAAKIDALPR